MRWGWRPYVPVARRRANAAREAARLQKKGEKVQSIQIEGRTIARTFWGKSWCENLEAYSDFENRLPRGRTYVRNGSVIDLKVHKGEVTALVSGSQIYKVKVSIKVVAAARWKQIIRSCSGSVDSLMDLLQGRFADAVMQKLTCQESGLFPTPKDISFQCSCPDWAYMCKHVAAVLYGIGARLDQEPELLFVLRDADHLELVAQATTVEALDSTLQESSGRALEADDLESVFGIDLETSTAKTKAPSRRKSKTTTGTARSRSATSKESSDKRPSVKKAAKKKTAKESVSRRKTPVKSTVVVLTTTKKSAKKKSTTTRGRKPKSRSAK